MKSEIKNFWVLQEKGKIDEWMDCFKEMSAILSKTPTKELISVKANFQIFKKLDKMTESLRKE